MKRNSKSNYKQIAKKAEEFISYFQRVTRPSSGEEIYTLQNHAPQPLRELVRTVHGDFLPDDFRYETIVEAIEALSRCDSEDELEEVRLVTDVYYHDLLKWLHSDLKRINYCDEAKDEFGLNNSELMTVITYGQQLEKDEIVASVREALSALCD